MFPFGSNSPSTKLRLRSFVHTSSLQIDSIFAESHSRSDAVFRLMDSGPADEYWLAEFVGEDEDWVSKYVQHNHLVDEESDGIGGRSTPTENTVNVEIASIPTSISSSAVTQQHTSTQQKTERIPFNKRWSFSSLKLNDYTSARMFPSATLLGL